MIADYKYRLSSARLSVQLCLLGLLVGVIASGLIIIFQLSVLKLQDLMWLGAEDFTQLPQWMRVALPISGAAAIAAMIYVSHRHYRRTGIAFVIHRIHKHYGRIPLGSGFNQFVTAVLALITGFSVGREGPAVHIGASAATMITKRWSLPDNTTRILSSCGVAAGISAIFNTPLAGVLFVLEVVLREYKLHYFLPITIAAMTASLGSRLVFGDVHLYSSLELPQMPLEYYPTLVLFGLILGVVAALFSRLLLRTNEVSSGYPLLIRLMAAGLITAIIGFAIPEAMGGEHHVVALSHVADSSVLLLATLLVAKMALSIAAIGLGIPGGIIGPMYGIGALLGGTLCLLFSPLLPSITEYLGIYSALGMTAMMAVCLNAPLAGLVALVELTNNATVILPFLLITVPALLLAHLGLGAKQIFLRQLDVMGLGYRVRPVENALAKTGVLALMHTDLVAVRPDTPESEQLELLKSAPNSHLLMATKQGQTLINLHSDFTDADNCPIDRSDIDGVPDHATLAEVYQLLSPKRRGMVYVYHGDHSCPIGLISWSMLHSFARNSHD
ncbi:chloride channel protein [Ferrimonas lipolytica]|uniref:Chloride channel protein n=1 Tax=Ferrimonas lipolytica TaxID=2724191 RepID=A0A6H1UHX7_9GAMM|nr:chloride channel protein [Ferrimonas lipolytica]QIZ78707.1 chloride channel protein [Ferrimonas lipolytica]